MASVVFSSPEVATVGLSEESAKEQCQQVDVFTSQFVYVLPLFQHSVCPVMDLLWGSMNCTTLCNIVHVTPNSHAQAPACVELWTAEREWLLALASSTLPR